MADGSNPLSGNAVIGKCNVSISALGVPALVNDFWSNNRGATAGSAFTIGRRLAATPTATPAATSISARTSSTTVFATTLTDAPGQHDRRNSASRPAATSRSAAPRFKGYTQGPRYWGKTFFIWPPDPHQRLAAEVFFGTRRTTPSSGTRPGNWRDPVGQLHDQLHGDPGLDQDTGPNPFPSQLRSGNILYYDQIPSDVPASAYTHTNLNSAITDSNQRFWKEYIDYVVGVLARPVGDRPASRPTPR